MCRHSDGERIEELTLGMEELTLGVERLCVAVEAVFLHELKNTKVCGASAYREFHCQGFAAKFQLAKVSCHFQCVFLVGIAKVSHRGFSWLFS